MYRFHSTMFKTLTSTCVFALLSAQPTWAQNANILLQTEDGQLSIEGQFVSFNTDAYTILHPDLGQLRVAIVPSLKCIGDACPDLSFTEPEVVLPPNFVTLRNPAGTIEIEGEFLEFTGSAYVIDSVQLGRLIVSTQSGIECFGDACPDAAAIAASTAPAASDQQVIIGVSQEFGGLIADAAEAYARQVGGSFSHDEERNIVQILDASDAPVLDLVLRSDDDAATFGSLAGGEADIVLSDAVLTEDALNRFGLADIRGTDNELALARDAVVLLANPANPLQSLSSREIAGLWSGEISNWRELGGPDQPVEILAVSSMSSDLDLISTAFLQPQGISETIVRNVDDLAQLQRALNTSPGAIALVRQSALGRAPFKQLGIREQCGLVARPTLADISTGSYPLSRGIYMYRSPSENSDDLSDFLAWLGSKDGRASFSQAGMLDYQPPRISLASMGEQIVHAAANEAEFSGPQFVRMTQVLGNAERLAYSFQFESGSSRLTDRAIDAIEAMADEIVGSEMSSGDLVLVGFTDSVGSASNNTQLAQLRAEIVRNALGDAIARKGGRVPSISVDSFGELMPLSCNDTTDGRERNRRVEAWIRPQAG